MPSKRVMQAMSRLENALSRLERAADERTLAPNPPHVDRDKVEAALNQLDSLIADLKGKPHG